MKLGKKILWGIVLCMVMFSLVACGKEEPKFEETILDELPWYKEVNVEKLPFSEREGKQESFLVYLWDAFVTENGTFQFSQENFCLEFCDATTNRISPLCSKANCRHNDTSCNVYFPFKYGSPNCLYYDGTYLYYEFSQSSEKTVWYRQNLDGSDRVQVFSVEEDFVGGWVVYKDKNVYFVTLDYEVKGVDEASGEQAGMVKYHIYEGNIETGAVRPFTCEFTGELVSLELLGMYENQILVMYSLQTSSEPLDNLRKVFLYDVTEHTMTGVVAWDSSRNIALCSEAVSDGLFPFTKMDMETEYLVDDAEYPYYEGQFRIGRF